MLRPEPPSPPSRVPAYPVPPAPETYDPRAQPWPTETAPESPEWSGRESADRSRMIPAAPVSPVSPVVLVPVNDGVSSGLARILGVFGLAFLALCNLFAVLLIFESGTARAYHAASECAGTPNFNCRAYVSGVVQSQRFEYHAATTDTDPNFPSAPPSPETTPYTLHLTVALPDGSHDFTISDHRAVEPGQFGAATPVRVEQWRETYTRLVTQGGVVAETADNPDARAYRSSGGMAISAIVGVCCGVPALWLRRRIARAGESRSR